MGCLFPKEADESNRSSENEPLLSEEFVKDVKGEPTDKKWYHGQISNQEADNRLRSAAGGTNGSYLVYDNPIVRGQYVLLVYHKGDLLRWMIRTTRPDHGMYILGNDGPGVVRYRTIRELIKAHRGITGKQIKIEGGGALTLSKCRATTNDEERPSEDKSIENSPVVTPVNSAKNEQSGTKWYAKKPAEPQLSKSNEKCPVVARVVVKDSAKNELVDKEWYRGSISNKEADSYLDEVSQGHADGSYIVYDNPVTSGQYILLVYYKSEMLRWKIQKCPTDDMYILGDDGPEVNRYKTVKELIKAHRGMMGKPIETEKGGIVTLRKM